jgi:phage nucleotide-binding protein
MATKKKTSDADVVKRIAKVDTGPMYLKLLVYGKNGRGKTRFAASGPNTLLIDCNEKGTMSVRDRDIDVYYLEDFRDLDALYWHLAEGTHKYKSVALDTVSNLQRLGMQYVLEESVAMDASKDAMMPTKRDWGKLAELMRTCILNFRNLPMNVIFTCQERVNDDGDETTGAEVFPEVSPGTRSTLCASVDIIGRLYTKQKEDKSVEYRMLVGPSERYLSKDRSGKLPRAIRNPNVPGLIKVLSRMPSTKKGE